jgi:hypothetical protein
MFYSCLLLVFLFLSNGVPHKLLTWYDHQVRDPRMRITIWVMLMTQRMRDNCVLRGRNRVNALYNNEAGHEIRLSWLGPLGP